MAPRLSPELKYSSERDEGGDFNFWTRGQLKVEVGPTWGAEINSLSALVPTERAHAQSGKFSTPFGQIRSVRSLRISLPR